MTDISRRHGCQPPFNAHQVFGILIWCCVVAGFFSLHLPELPTQSVQTGVAVGYSLCVALVTYLYLVVSLKDPADAGDVVDSPDRAWLCTLCEKYVHRQSKHCRECNKCIEGFDHHCKWVNNCIGRYNYRPFLALLAIVCTMLALQLAVGVYLFARCFYNPEAARAALSAYPTFVSFPGYIAAISVYILVVAVALYPLGELWLLHMVLITKGMTTYDYIMANRQRMAHPEEQQTSSRTGPAHILRSVRMCCSSKVADETILGSRNLGTSQGSPGRGRGIKKVPLNPCLALSTPLSHWSYTGRAPTQRPPAANSQLFDAANLTQPAGLLGAASDGCNSQQPPYSPRPGTQSSGEHGRDLQNAYSSQQVNSSTHQLPPAGMQDQVDAVMAQAPPAMPQLGPSSAQLPKDPHGLGEPPRATATLQMAEVGHASSASSLPSQ